MIVIEVTLTQFVTDDGRLAVGIQTPEHYNAVEVLGLLEIAKLQIADELRAAE